ncbi:unnamed protein product, partial [Durusdinium trenchii]
EAASGLMTSFAISDMMAGGANGPMAVPSGFKQDRVGGQQLREHNILDTIEEQITWSTAASTPQILIIDSFHKHSDEKHLEKQVLGA